MAFRCIQSQKYPWFQVIENKMLRKVSGPKNNDLSVLSVLVFWALALKIETVCLSKTMISITRPHGVTTQKTNINIFTTMRT
jgi:hypothetical protein